MREKQKCKQVNSGFRSFSPWYWEFQAVFLFSCAYTNTRQNRDVAIDTDLSDFPSWEAETCPSRAAALVAEHEGSVAVLGTDDTGVKIRRSKKSIEGFDFPFTSVFWKKLLKVKAAAFKHTRELKIFS